jgi:hypothetical protein
LVAAMATQAFQFILFRSLAHLRSGEKKNKHRNVFSNLEIIIVFLTISQYITYYNQ